MVSQIRDTGCSHCRPSILGFFLTILISYPITAATTPLLSISSFLKKKTKLVFSVANILIVYIHIYNKNVSNIQNFPEEPGVGVDFSSSLTRITYIALLPPTGGYNALHITC